jgi:hypothetical protein
MAELKRIMDLGFFFGEEGPEPWTSAERVALAGSAAHKVLFPVRELSDDGGA